MGRAKLNVSNLSITIPEEEKNQITYADFQSCACFDKVCNNACFLRFDGELGAGIGGTVSKVFNIKTGCTWAKKALSKNVNSVKDIKRLLDEVEVIKKCDSPYVIKTFGAYYKSNQINCFMEYMDVGSLDVILYKINRIPERVLSKIARHVVRGLDYLFREIGISHRDVKPSNILLNQNGDIKLCDFGISSAPDQLNSAASAGVNKQFFGTPAYMSPERLRNVPFIHRSQEEQADIWSLGITILQLSIGDYPLPMPTEEKLSQLVVYDANGILPRLPGRNCMNEFCIPIFGLMNYFDEVSPNLPEKIFSVAIREFIHICLQKVPEMRTSYLILNNHSFLYLDTFSSDETEYYGWLNNIKGYTKND